MLLGNSSRPVNSSVRPPKPTSQNIMNRKVKRPPSVWITQVIFLLFGLPLSLLLLSFFLQASAGGKLLSTGFIILVLQMLTLLVILGIAFWGLAKRKAYARWLGVVSLVLVWGLIIVWQVLLEGGSFKHYEFNSTAERAGVVIAQVLIHGLFLLLISRLAFGKRAREFFDRKYNGE